MINSNGTTLVLNLLVMAVFAMMAAVVYASAKTMVGEVVYNSRSAQALAIAEAGLEDAMHSLYQNNTWRTGFVNKSFAGGTYTVTLTTDTITAPTITSTGYSAALLLRGPAVRTVSALVEYVAGDCPYAVISDKAMTIDGRVDAYDISLGLTPSATSFTTGAHVHSNTSVSVGGASCPPAHIFGNVTALGSVPSASCVSGTIATTTTAFTVPLSPCGSCETVNNNSTGISPLSAWNQGADSLDVNAGQTVTLSTGVFYFKKITVSGTGILNVNTSSGSTSIHLKNNFTGSAGCQVNNTSKIPSRLHIYGTNFGNSIRLNCSSPLHAYLEGSQSQFELAQELYGHFCADSVRISSTTGEIGLVHYDIGGGAVKHVAWTTGTDGSWTESYKRQ